MTNPITHAEASKALAQAMAQQVQVADGMHYYVTAAPAETYENGDAVYMVGYATADPEESDEDGEPTLFKRTLDGAAVMAGPAF
jgi:hypothetical protein